MKFIVLFMFAIAAIAQNIPRFEADASFPKPMPNGWMLGQVSGTAVDAHDHVWILHRPRTLDEHDRYGETGKGDCCKAAPAVIEFDAQGNVVQAWGGPATPVLQKGASGEVYEWPDNEHGIFVDHKDNVWITGNGDKDGQILKFTKSGKFLLQIGHNGKSRGSNDTENLGRPAALVVWPATNEVFVADGYANRRVVVYDAETGAYKRHWGAYGKKPDDASPRTRVLEGDGAPQFNLVHGLRISNDGMVYVGDRVNNRVQVFRLDGTFLKEVYLQRKNLSAEGTAFDVAFSSDKAQRYMFVPDGSNKKVHILDRQSLEILGFFGGRGGHGVGEFYHIHSIAADSKGNMYLGEVNNGRRVQRWNFKGK
jgi:DNA-binding beta-propeller fold protein YncE